MREFDKNTWDKKTYKGKGILITVLFCFSFFFNSAVIAGSFSDSSLSTLQFTPSVQFTPSGSSKEKFPCGKSGIDNCVSCERNVRFTDYGHDNSASDFSNDDNFSRIQDAAQESNYDYDYDYDDYVHNDNKGSTTVNLIEAPDLVVSVENSYTCKECALGYTLMHNKCIPKKEECESRGDDYYWVEAKKTCYKKASCSETQGYIWDDEDKTCITKKDSCNKKEGHLWNDVDKTCVTKKDSCNKKEGHVWKNNQCITKKKECEGREDHYWVEAKKACYNKDSCSETQGYIWNDEDKTCITKKDRSGVKGSFGAEIFCTMRDGGNDHESSWEAAYAYIKKQKGGLFKVSPKQAAVQITEAVIRDRRNSSYCVEYLDQLHPNRQFMKDLQKEEQRKQQEAKNRENKRKRPEKELKEANEDISEETIDRYSY